MQLLITKPSSSQLIINLLNEYWIKYWLINGQILIWLPITNSFTDYQIKLQLTDYQFGYLLSSGLPNTNSVTDYESNTN